MGRRLQGRARAHPVDKPVDQYVGARGERPVSEVDLAEVWARSLDELAGMQIEPAHRAWLQLTRPLGLVENTALIATPNEFVKEQLETRLRALITNTLSRELGRNIQLAVTVDPSVAAPDADHSRSGLPDLDGAPAEPAADAGDGTGPLPRIGDHRTPQRGEFGAGTGEFGRPEDTGGDRLEGPGGRRPGGLGFAPGAAPGAPRPAQARLNPKYTFETFVIGSSNRFAHAA